MTRRRRARRNLHDAVVMQVELVQERGELLIVELVEIFDCLGCSGACEDAQAPRPMISGELVLAWAVATASSRAGEVGGG